MSQLLQPQVSSVTLPTRHLFSILAHSIAVNEALTHRADTIDFHSDIIFASGALLLTRSVTRKNTNVWGWSDYTTRTIRGRLSFTYQLNVEHQRAINRILAGLVRQGDATVTLRISAQAKEGRIELLSVPAGETLLDETIQWRPYNWGASEQRALELATTPGLAHQGITYLPRSWLGRERMRDQIGPGGFNTDTVFRKLLYQRITGPKESVWRKALTRVAQAWSCETVEVRLCQIAYDDQECVVFSTTGLNPAHHLALMR